MVIVFDNKIETDPTHVTAANGARLLDYWNAIRGERERPRWRDVDLMAIRDIAPYVTVKDAVEGGADFRNRFFGTQLVSVLGFDGTGKTMRDTYSGDSFDYVHGVASKAFQTLRPLQAGGGVFWARNKEHLNYTCLYLTLDGAPGVPAHLISVFDFRRAE